jgi:tetratricopeptide (TPR) repeat protein
MHRTGDMIIGIAGIIVIVGAVAYGIFRSLRISEDPARLIAKWIITIGLLIFGVWFSKGFGPIAPLIMLLFAVPSGLIWAPAVGEFVARPLTNMFDGGGAEVTPQPIYSIAEAKRHRGDYRGAITELRTQLQKFPRDFRATMLIASIEAEDMHDLPSAQLTVERLLEIPDHPVHLVASALNMMADWSLKYGEDAATAREYLERIVLADPNSPQAHTAAQRIATLGTGHHVAAAPLAHRYEVRQRESRIGLRSESKPTVQGAVAPESTAAELVNQLEEHPLDTGAREKLAVLYADEFKRIDLAADQLEQLVAIPAETPKNIARWLNLLATLHIRIASDRKSAEETLRRIIDLFPKTALADQAESRLGHLDSELRSKGETEAKKLGVYEQRLGLKKTGDQPVA